MGKKQKYISQVVETEILEVNMQIENQLLKKSMALICVICASCWSAVLAIQTRIEPRLYLNNNHEK